jgi:methylated-DNA-[protein]-cysteine S-methyltransferase
MFYTIYSSPFGPLALAATDKGIAMADFDLSERPLVIGSDWKKQEQPFQKALLLLDQYFAGRQVVFDLDYDLSGTPFQQAVWNTLLRIRPGATRSYGEIATSLGKPSAARAAGTAIGRNPVTLLIPCHRVIGANGSLTGFAGGLPLKRKLLEFEGVL